VRWAACGLALFLLAPAAPAASPEPAYWRLPSGLRVVAQQAPGSGLVAVAVLVGAAPRVEEASQAGLSILTREVMLQGTLRRSGEALADALDGIGASLRALTGADHTEWTLLVPVERVDPALELLVEVLTQPRFDPRDVETQRRISLVRLRQQREQPQARAVELANGLVYDLHPYRRPLLGTPETLERLDRDDLVRYHQTYYTAPNVVVSVAGDLPVPTAVAKVVRAFQGLRAEPLPRRVKVLDVVERALMRRPRERQEVFEAQQTASAWVAVSYLGVEVTHPDWAALRVAAGLLGGGMASRLFQSLRERQGLAYAVGAGFPTHQGPAALTMAAGVDPANVERALREMLREVEDLAARPPSEDEVARARSRTAGLHLLDHEDLRRRAFYPAWYELLGAGYRFDREVVRLLSQVTPADVQRVARRYLRHAAVAVVGPTRR
jgi:zinc protease